MDLGTVGPVALRRAFRRHLLRAPHCLAHSKPDARGPGAGLLRRAPITLTSVSSLLVAVLSGCVTEASEGPSRRLPGVREGFWSAGPALNGAARGSPQALGG